MIERFPNLSGCKLLACDTETRDPHLTEEGPGFVRGLAEVVGISLAWGPALEESVYMPIAHEGGGNWNREQVIAYLKDLLGSRVPTVWANAPYDLEGLACLGINVPGPLYDVQLAEYLLDENRQTYKLDALAEKYLGEHKLSDKLVRHTIDTFGCVEKEAMSFIWRHRAEDVAGYAMLDTNLTYRIHQAQLPLLSAEGLDPVYTLERDLLPIVHKMRMKGVRIDEARLDAAEREMRHQSDSLTAALATLAGQEVDIWSADSVHRGAERVGVALDIQRTEADNPSFTAAWLTMQTHPYWVALLEARQVDKLINTFLTGVRHYLVNGRVFPQWRQARYDSGGTKTGRFSSAHPGFQQIPARNPKLANIARALILPEEGELFAGIDYSQQEPRLGVHYANILRLPGAQAAVERYHNDPAMSYHKMVQEITGLPYYAAKQLNLGLSYGMGPKKFAANAGVDYAQALAWFKQHHAGVPFVKGLANKAQAAAESRGYVKTILGRRRRFNLWGPRKYEVGLRPLPYDEAVEKWGKYVVRYFTYRAGNAVIQGSAADMMKRAMVDVYMATGIVPALTIHDELIISRPPGTIRADLAEVRRLMEEAIPLLVPVPTDAEIGPDLGNMEKV